MSAADEQWIEGVVRAMTKSRRQVEVEVLRDYCLVLEAAAAAQPRTPIGYLHRLVTRCVVAYTRQAVNSVQAHGESLRLLARATTG